MKQAALLNAAAILTLIGLLVLSRFAPVHPRQPAAQVQRLDRAELIHAIALR